MKEQNSVVVIGLGEVGKPLLQLLSKHYDTIGVDIVPPDGPLGKVDVLHICYPFEIKDFIGETARYIELFKPRLTVINSTSRLNDASGSPAKRRRIGTQPRAWQTRPYARRTAELYEIYRPYGSCKR